MNVWITQQDVIDELKDLGIDTEEWKQGSYSKLNKVILRAQRDFERLTRRKFEKVTITEKISGSGKPTIVLRYFPIVSITSIIVTDVPSYQQDVTVTEYRVDEETGVIHLVSTLPVSMAYFPEGHLNIEVIYMYGYELADIPDDIKDCILKMVLIRIIMRSPAEWESEGLKSIKISQYAEAYNVNKTSGGLFSTQREQWQNDINDIIMRFKRTLIA